MIRDLVYRILPLPRIGKKRFDTSRVCRVLVFRNGPNPTCTYYLEERLARLDIPYEVRELSSPCSDLDPSGTFIVICRYLLPKHVVWIVRNRKALAGVALFVDDDIAATVAEGEGSLRYRAYLFALGLAPLPFLRHALTHIWTSTDTLASRIHASSVLPPLPAAHLCRSERQPRSDPRDKIRIVFFAAGAHEGEHRFLVPIIEGIFRRLDNVSFHVIASGKAARRWQVLCVEGKRIEVLPPLSWPKYLQFTASERFDIVLVPMLRGLVNDARSDTKRIDIARMGAAAIFSEGPVYGRLLGRFDVLVENKPALWIEAIVRLAGDHEARQRNVLSIAETTDTMRRTAYSFLPGLENFSRTSSGDQASMEQLNPE